MTKAVVVSVQGNSLEQTMTAAQQQFDQLTARIKQQQHTLQQWQKAVLAVQQKIVGQLLPVYDELATHQVQLIQQLDSVLSSMKLNPRQQAQLIDVILLFAYRALDSRLSEAHINWLEQVIAHYQPQQHSDEADAELDEYALNEQLRAALMQPVMDAYAVDISEATVEELEFWSKQLDTDFGESQSQKKNNKQNQKTRSKAIKPTQANSADPDSEQKVAEQQADALASKSLKLVYQRLAARLHPDREIDEAQKVIKTALLQEVIHAYQQKDLMTLLNFQHELAPQNDSSLASFSDEQLKLYNLNLQKHSQQLVLEINKVRDQLAQDINNDALSEPKQAIQWINTHIKNTQYWIQSIQYALTHLNNKQDVNTFLQQFGDY